MSLTVETVTELKKTAGSFKYDSCYRAGVFLLRIFFNLFRKNAKTLADTILMGCAVSLMPISIFW